MKPQGMDGVVELYRESLILFSTKITPRKTNMSIIKDGNFLLPFRFFWGV